MICGRAVEIHLPLHVTVDVFGVDSFIV